MPTWYIKSYSEIKHRIANTPKMAANVGGKLELEIFMPTQANESEVEVCFYFSPIDKHDYYFFFHLGFSPDIVKYGEIGFKSCATFSVQ